MQCPWAHYADRLGGEAAAGQPGFSPPCGQLASLLYLTSPETLLLGRASPEDE